jgi:hypothetical protein
MEAHRRSKERGGYMQTHQIALLCEISRGAFSAERIFRIKLPNQEEYVGAASLDYCYTDKGRPLESDQPPPGKTIKGKIEARFIQEKEGGTMLVAVPDGAVLTVGADQKTEFPKQVSPNVPV